MGLAPAGAKPEAAVLATVHGCFRDGATLQFLSGEGMEQEAFGEALYRAFCAHFLQTQWR